MNFMKALLLLITTEVNVGLCQVRLIFQMHCYMPVHASFLFADNLNGYTAPVEVTASNYFSPDGVIQREHTPGINVIGLQQVCGVLVPITGDNNKFTCINITKGNDRLQAIFTFPSLLPSHYLSVKVILRNVEDCSSLIWTWYTESDCDQTIYSECASEQITRIAGFTQCVVTCHCLNSCSFLFLKYNRLPWLDQTSEQLCEIRARKNSNE